MRYAFAFDASACTGCKACQVACKDRNALDAGVLWRRVYEVTGGTWERQGAAWTNTVFSYNVSVGCNHCVDPPCAAVCPSDAYGVRDDGIVWIEGGKCLGCGYCAWACPYGAPQYSARLGRMTKCDLCRDLVDDGLQPACVAACPMRALDLVQASEPPVAPPPFPLPAVARTRPSLAIKPHPAMSSPLPKTVANREEVAQRSAAGARELPLVAFTLIGQGAAGLAFLSVVTATLSRPVLLAIGVSIAAAALASLFHLGSVRQAWRAPANAGRSALSREIAMLVVFASAWLAAVWNPAIGSAALAVAALGLVYGMASVCRLDAVPGWNAWRVRGAFGLSALLLGAWGLLALHAQAIRVPVWLVAIAGVPLLVQQWSGRQRFYLRLLDRPM